MSYLEMRQDLSLAGTERPGERRLTRTEPHRRTEPALRAVRSTGLFGRGWSIVSTGPFAALLRLWVSSQLIRQNL